MSNRDIDITVAPYASDVFIVWAITRGLHTPIASCGSAAHAEIVQSALRLMVREAPNTLAGTLSLLPRTAVPSAHEPIPGPPVQEQT